MPEVVRLNLRTSVVLVVMDGRRGDKIDCSVPKGGCDGSGVNGGGSGSLGDRTCQ